MEGPKRYKSYVTVTFVTKTESLVGSLSLGRWGDRSLPR